MIWQRLGLAEKPRILFSRDLQAKGQEPWVLFVYEGAFSFPTLEAAAKRVQRYYSEIAIVKCVWSKPKTRIIQ